MESLPGSIEVPLWQNSINWESAGAFKVRWLAICNTRFSRIGYLRNALNENVPVLIGKDGQEIEEECGRGLLEVMDVELEGALREEENGGREREGAGERGGEREWEGSRGWNGERVGGLKRESEREREEFWDD